MSAEITISTRALGRRKRLLDDWSIPFPPEFADGGEPLTLRDLITKIVCEEVRRFKDRQDRRRMVQVLSAREIEEGAAKGKIDSGGRDLNQDVDQEQAVGVALLAFEDGLYLVIIDDQEHRDLDAEVFLKPDSRITFLRLIMLAGG
jgi:hypothetical protein